VIDIGFGYQGGEIELFTRATSWKRYFCSLIRPYLGRRVLEAGAGIGANVEYLMVPPVEAWVCLEPDAKMSARLLGSRLPDGCRVVAGTIARIPVGEPSTL
jgi:hypothetical protein